MNEIEPVRPVRRQIVPRATSGPSMSLNREVLEGAWPLERYRLQRQARWEVFEEQLAALRAALRMANLNRLTMQKIQYQVQLADEVDALLARNPENPLLAPLLEQTLADWLAQSRHILSNFVL